MRKQSDEVIAKKEKSQITHAELKTQDFHEWGNHWTRSDK
jgi:hypothetical protein